MKKIFICLIAAIQLLNAGGYNAFAEDTYIKNFSRKNTYAQNQFTDVNSEWFASSVQQVYETGLMYGDSENTFNPNGNIDNAAVITIAARLHSIYNYGTEDFNTNASVWYEPYIDYAVSNGICDSGISPYDLSTRSFFAGVIGNAADSSIFEEKNKIEDGTLPDVTGWYSNAVYNFYRAGVLSGNDQYGTFAPDSPITRAEAAAILSRIVKPSERVDVALKSKPVGTYDIMEDDGSFEAFRQRAVLANLKVLLNGEPKGDDWYNDVWTIDHAEIPGDNIYVRHRDIEIDIDGDLIFIFVPNRYLGKSGDAYTRVGDWSLYTGFRSFLSDYTGSMPNGLHGDLYLSKPEVAGYTETYTYDNYTNQAKVLINNTPNPVIDKNLVRQYISNTYGEGSPFTYIAPLAAIYIGYLTDWEENWYLTMNKNNMYQPFPRESNNKNQTEYTFTPANASIRQWCKKNFGKYVLILVSRNTGKPLMLTEISGYSYSKDNVTAKSWYYSGDSLNVEWQGDVSLNNPLIINEINSQKETPNTNGLLPAIPAKNGSYSLQYKDSQADYNNRFFSMSINGDDIVLIGDNYTNVFLSLNSNKAVIVADKDSQIISKDNPKAKTVTVTAPKKIDNTIYLPAKFVIDALFNNVYSDNSSSNELENEYNKEDDKSVKADNNEEETFNEEDEIFNEEDETLKEIEALGNSGYAKICNDRRGDWAYYLEGHDDIRFRFRRESIIQGYKYGLSRTYNGPHIGFNLNSKEAIVQVWYNGTEYGEQVISIPEPKEINGDIYLPVDEISKALAEKGYDFEKKKLR